MEFILHPGYKKIGQKSDSSAMMTGFPSTRTIMFSWDEKIPHVARSFQKETCRTEKLSSIDATC